MKINFRWIISGLGMLLISFSCSNNAEEFVPTCDGTLVSFFNDVKPIVDSRCATNSGCHSSGSSNGALTTYNQIFQARNQISNAIQNGSMPRGSSLTSNQKTSIICWIQNGAANN